MPPAVALTYPGKPVRIVVPFPPGSGIDIVTRTISPPLSASLGTPLVIDNRPGADGSVGAQIVAKAAADGYTLLIATGGILTVLPIMLNHTPYAPRRDFAPIALLAATPNILLVHPSLAAKSVRELITLAREAPGKLNYASTGNGTGSHLAAELFRIQAGINITHIPYQGSTSALADLIGARVDLFFNNALTALPQIRSGRLRALGVTSPARISIAPEVPTVAEAGLPGFAAETWYGLLAPAGTPRAIIQRINSQVSSVLQRPEIRERLASDGARPVGDTAEQFGAYIKSETAKWQKVIKALALRAD